MDKDNDKNNKMVKARSISDMIQNKTKVQFIPTPSSVRRMKKAYQVNHIRTENNISRFESNR